jgi:hypothetical protein
VARNAAFNTLSERGVFIDAAEAATAEVAPAVPLFKGDLLNKSYYPTGADAANINKNWYIIDAKGQTLGRMATLAATYIRYPHSCLRFNGCSILSTRLLVAGASTCQHTHHPWTWVRT